MNKLPLSSRFQPPTILLVSQLVDGLFFAGKCETPGVVWMPLQRLHSKQRSEMPRYVTAWNESHEFPIACTYLYRNLGLSKTISSTEVTVTGDNKLLSLSSSIHYPLSVGAIATHLACAGNSFHLYFRLVYVTQIHGMCAPLASKQTSIVHFV